jgi:hypothetical protein
MSSDQQWTIKNEFHEDWLLLKPMLCAFIIVLAIIGLYVVIRNIIDMYRENKK